MAIHTKNLGNAALLKKIPIVQLSDGVPLPADNKLTTITNFIANASGEATRVEFLVGTDNQNISKVQSDLTTEGNSSVQAKDLSADITIVNQTPTEQNDLFTAFNGKNIRIIYLITPDVDSRVDKSTGVVTPQVGDQFEITHTARAAIDTNNVSGQRSQSLLSYTKQIGADLDSVAVNDVVVAD